MMSEVSRLINGLLQIRSSSINTFTGAPQETTLVLDEGLDDFFDSKMNEFFQENRQANEIAADSVSDIMLTRKREFYKKLALLHALSRGDTKLIKKVDLDWAEEFYNVGFYNQKHFLSEAMAENENHAHKEMIYSLILKHPNITKRDLGRKTQKLMPKLRDTLIQDLIDTERVVKIEETKANNKKQTKYLVLADSSDTSH